MSNIEMTANAALYLGSSWQSARNEGARAFRTAAQAVRFAMEEAAPVSRKGALLIVNGQSYSGNEIAELYQSTKYPFERKSVQKYRSSRISRMRRILS